MNLVQCVVFGYLVVILSFMMHRVANQGGKKNEEGSGCSLRQQTATQENREPSDRKTAKELWNR